MTIIQPQRDLIFVTRKQNEKQTDSGIVIPENVQGAQDRGTVVAVGPGKTYSNGNLIPLTVKVGDQVIFNEHAGQTTRLDDGEEVLVMREDDVLAIIEGEL
jgi:chaperonin GroES